MKFKSNIATLGLVFGVFIASCAPTQQPPQSGISTDTIDLEQTVGSVSKIYFFDAIPVRGIGIVAGLPGTGSSECPRVVRDELEKYIRKQIPADGTINPRNFIESNNTAVVEVFGVIPALASESDAFDIAVRPLSRSQTTSLDGGHLYTTELKELSRLVRIDQFSKFSKTLGTAKGPIYSSADEDNKWYVLGGAQPLKTPKITLILNNPDFLTASAIRNRITERFGSKTAIALSEAEILLQVPTRYQYQKEHYLQLIQSLQLGDKPATKEKHIRELVQKLIAEPEKDSPEIALEAIGKPAMDSLAECLEHPDESVRFHAARCLLTVGDYRALSTLRKILLNSASPFRTAAVEAIGRNAKPSEALAILMIALGSPDFQVRLKAYEMLLPINSPMIDRMNVAGNFVVDSVTSSGPKVIYIYQQKNPRIVLFGAPFHCQQNLFIQSDDGTITINAKPDDEFLSVSRKHPQRPRVLGPISSGYEVSSLIETLGGLPEESNDRINLRPGLAVSYAEIIPILKKLCEIDAIPAQFIAEPPITLDPALQNLTPIGR